MDIIITIPKSIKWDEYKEELLNAEKGQILNFKVNNFPTKVVLNKSKCYICHDGFIKGYMIITGMESKNFTCTTTGNHWKGNFIERTGKFYPVKEIPHKGFQGYKYIDYNLLNKTLNDR